jgi:hypothetical protein
MTLDKPALETNRVNVYGNMICQISEASKNRIKETVTEGEAMETHDPRLLLQAIISTHLTDNRLGADHNLFKVEQAFNSYSMGKYSGVRGAAGCLVRSGRRCRRLFCKLYLE